MSPGVARPSIPSLTWLVVGMWAGAVAGESLTWRLWGGLQASGPESGVSLAAVRVAPSAAGAVAVVLAIGVVLLCRGDVRASVRAGAARPVVTLAILAVSGVALGLVISALHGAAWLQDARVAADTGAREWCGTVEADPRAGSFGTTLRVSVEGGPLDGARVSVRWPKETEVPELGRRVRFSAVLAPVPRDEEWGRRTARAGVCATGSAWRAEVGGWRTGVGGLLLAWRADALHRMHEVPGVGGDLLEGVVLGDRRRLAGSATDEEFRILGLSHLVAVSGSHLAMACGAVALAGRALRVSRVPLVCLTFAAGAAYAVVTGLPYSALRSLLMLAVGGGAMLCGRRTDGVAALVVSVAAVVASDPWAVFDLGFQLSVIAVAGLLLFGGLATEWAGAGLPLPLRGVGGVIALTGIAQVLTAPVIAAAFGMVSVIAPVANAYAGPMISLAMFVGLIAAVVGTIHPVAGETVAHLAAAVLEAAARLSHHLAGVPGAAASLEGGPLLVVGVIGLATVIWVRWPRPRSPASSRRAVAALVIASIAFALGPRSPHEASVTVLDVGQGDAIVVRDAGRTMLVDAGEDPTVLRQALARHGVRRVDVLVLTHAHDDHTGGARGLAGVCTLGWIGVPCVGSPCVQADAAWPGAGTWARSLHAGEVWRLGRFEVSVIWPPLEPATELETNDTSVVLHLSRGEFDMVLTGDAEAEAQRGMHEAGGLREVEVLKVPHHGSVNGLTAEALEVWDPAYALISVGDPNRFGHPHTGTLELLGSNGVRVLRTDRHGDIAVEIGRTGFRVRSSRGGGAVSVRERIETPDDRVGAAVAPVAGHLYREKGHRGRQRPRTAQACVPDTRRPGAPAGARAPPSPAAGG